jgi:hypothetical protein
MGYLRIDDPDPWRSRGQVSVLEQDTFTCVHCGHIVKLVLKPRINRPLTCNEVDAKNVSWCSRCNDYICDPCRATPCDPMQAKLDRWEKGQK